MPPKKPLSPPDRIQTSKYSHTGIEEADKILKDVSLMPSTIETIDYAMYTFLNEKLNLSVNTNKGFTKVPIIWVSGERAFQIKNNRGLRDDNGVLIFPMINVERTSVTKDPNFKGIAWAHVPNTNDEKGGAIVVARRIKQDKTANFANSDNARIAGTFNIPRGSGQQNYVNPSRKVVYETLSMPIPTYVQVNYKVSIRTEYMQQMNELITPFFTKTGQINNIFMSYDGHRFEGFIEGDFSQTFNSSNFQDDEKTFLIEIDIKVLGYLLGEGSNSDRPKLAIRENAVTFKFGKEQVIFDENPPFTSKSFYRR
jgi:hypothetical protein